MSSSGQILRKSRSAFVLFVRQYEHVFIIIGAVIVFATFTVKEGLRERLKDLVDSLNLARSVYAIRSDHSQLAGQIVALHGHLGNIRANLTPPQESEEIDYTADITDDLEFVEAQLRQVDTSVDNTREILKQLPSNAAKRKIIEDLDRRSSELFMKVRDYNNEVNSREGPESFQMYQKVRKLADESYSFCVVGFGFGAEAIAAAEKVRDERESNYKRYTLISYILYGVGWGMGLLTALCRAGRFEYEMERAAAAGSVATISANGLRSDP